MKYPKHRKFEEEDIWKLWILGYVEQEEWARHLLITNFSAYILRRLNRKYGSYRYDVFHDVVIYLTTHLQNFDPAKGSIVNYIEGAIRNTISKNMRETKIYRNTLPFGDIARLFGEDESVDDSFGGEVKLQPTDELRCIDNDTPFTVMDRAEYGDVRKRIIEESLQELDIIERYIMCQRYIVNRTLDDIAQELGYASHGSILHIINRCIKVMRKCADKYKDDLR